MYMPITAALSLAVSLGICAGTDAFSGFSWLWILPVGFAGTFLGIMVISFLFVWACCAVVDIRKPQEEDSPFYRWLTGFAIEFALGALQVRLHVTGLEQLPKEGRILLVCNHLSLLDPLILLKVFRRQQLAFISKQENQTMFIVGKLMHKILCQPINRENDREALKTIIKCIKMLQADQVSVGVFPEGYTSRDGLLHSFRNGVFKIAQKAQVPIVVCTLQDSQHIFHNAARLRPTRVEMHLTGVVPAQETKGITTVELGGRVHAMMAEDIGEDLVYHEPQKEETP